MQHENIKILPQVTDEDLIIEQALRIISARLQYGAVFNDPQSIKDYLVLHLAQCKHEIFGMISLNSANQLIKIENLFRGTLNQSSVYPREVVKAALDVNAAKVIFYHNHPGGTTSPSTSDVSLTENLGRILHKVDVNVVDHIIVGGSETYSFVEAGILQRLDFWK